MQLGAVGHSRLLCGGTDGMLALEQSASRSAAVARLLLAAPMAVVCLLPVLSLAVAGASDTGVSEALAGRPASTALLALGLVLAAALVAMPIRAGVDRLAGRQMVCIAEGDVTVVREGLLGRSMWREPLSRYLGVAHHIRASLSGPRHEIVLVHADPARSVLLQFGTVVTEQELRSLAVRLAKPVVPARAMYGEPV